MKKGLAINCSNNCSELWKENGHRRGKAKVKKKGSSLESNQKGSCLFARSEVMACAAEGDEIGSCPYHYTTEWFFVMGSVGKRCSERLDIAAPTPMTTRTTSNHVNSSLANVGTGKKKEKRRKGNGKEKKPKGEKVITWVRVGIEPKDPCLFAQSEVMACAAEGDEIGS